MSNRCPNQVVAERERIGDQPVKQKKEIFGDDDGDGEG